MTSRKDDWIEPFEGAPVSRREFAGHLAKLGVAIGGGASMLSALAGAANAEQPLKAALIRDNKGDVVIGVISTLAIEFYTEWNTGAQVAAKALGLKWNLEIDSTNISQTESIVNTKISQGAKLFATSSLALGNEPIIAKSILAGGGLLINNYNIPDWYTPFESGPGHIAFLAPDETVCATKLTEIVVQAAGGKGNFVHLTGNPTTPVDWRRTEGVNAGMKKFPNAKIIASVPANWDRVTAKNVMSSLIVKYGKKIDGVFGQNDDTTLGALAALDAAGMNVPSFGMDGVSEVLALVKTGKVTADEEVFPWWIGGYNLVCLYDAANGFKRTPPERMMFSQAPALTRKGGSNSLPVSRFKDKIHTLDWKLMSRVLHPHDWDPQNLLYPINPARMFAPRTKDKPKNWVNPMAASIKSGQFKQITKMYAEHYQRKII